MEHLLHHLLDPSHLHPAIVHFPIALLTVSVFLDILSFLLKRDDFRRTGFHLLALGVLAAVAAIGAGLMAAETVDAPKDILKLHASLAVITGVLFLVLLGWRAAARNNISPKLFPLYLVIGAVGAFMILAVGFWGGHMVFEEGAGVRKDLLHKNHPAAMSGGEEKLPEPSFATGEDKAKAKPHTHDHGNGHEHKH